MSGYGVGIRCENPWLLQKHAWLTETRITADPAYEPGAVVPDASRRSRPSAAELEPFLADSQTPAGGSIELIHFSAPLRDYLLEHPQQTKPTICKPNQLTTTENTGNKNLRTGLHLDSKENRPLATRFDSQRRIGLNNGPGLRYLLIGSLDAFSLGSQLGEPESFIPTTGDVREYVAGYQAYGRVALRCLWLPLEPGHAYIAPTEVAIHDGSTFGSSIGSTIQFWIGAPGPGELGSIF